MFLLKVDIKTIGDSEHDLVGHEGNGAGTNIFYINLQEEHIVLPIRYIPLVVNLLFTVKGVIMVETYMLMQGSSTLIDMTNNIILIWLSRH